MTLRRKITLFVFLLFPILIFYQQIQIGYTFLESLKISLSGYVLVLLTPLASSGVIIGSFTVIASKDFSIKEKVLYILIVIASVLVIRYLLRNFLVPILG